MQSLYESGRTGEKTAWEILQELGFTWVGSGDVPSEYASASDLNVMRMGQKFAINVKHSTKGGPFIVTWGNLRRLIRYREIGYKPAFLFLFQGNYFLFSFEDNFPQNKKKRKTDMVLEKFAQE